MFRNDVGNVVQGRDTLLAEDELPDAVEEEFRVDVPVQGLHVAPDKFPFFFGQLGHIVRSSLKLETPFKVHEMIKSLVEHKLTDLTLNTFHGLFFVILRASHLRQQGIHCDRENVVYVV